VAEEERNRGRRRRRRLDTAERAQEGEQRGIRVTGDGGPEQNVSESLSRLSAHFTPLKANPRGRTYLPRVANRIEFAPCATGAALLS